MKLPGLRWWIVSLLFLAAVLNYVDKNTLALLAPTIQKDLGFGDQAYANIQNAFQIAYTIALLGSGVIVDKLGPRLSLGLFVAWWSVANVLTTCARSIGSLGIFRFLLGLGEAGNWTASPKAVAEWFPAKERGFAIGVYTAGTPIGMTLAPIFIIWLAGAFGWRSTFVVTGLLGLLWLIPWLVLYRSARTHGWLTDRERAWILSEESNTADAGATEKGWSWLQAFGRIEVWCLLIGRMLSDPVWFFYQNWYPKYLVSARGLTQADVTITWVMFLAAGVGSLCGGWVSGRFIKRGRAPERVRLFTMLGCAFFMPLSPFVAWAPSVSLSLAFASVIVFAHLAWLVNIGALVVDVVPKRSLATVFGIIAAGSSLGAIGMNDLVAKLVEHYSYTNWFVIAACLHLAVIPLVMWGIMSRKSKAGLQSPT
jgi:ACS family hexuronate transporter-like MFS transporter